MKTRHSNGGGRPWWICLVLALLVAPLAGAQTVVARAKVLPTCPAEGDATASTRSAPALNVLKNRME